MNRTSLVTCAILFTASAAFADDLTPPSWRGSPGTTVQHWDFTGGPGGGIPDALPLNNPYGTPMLTPLGGALWTPAAFGRTEIWDLSGNGTLDFRVPNTGVATHEKELWLQVTFYSVAALPPPTYSFFTPVGSFTLLSSTVTALPGGWSHELTRWYNPICPPLEAVQILPAQVGAITLIDQVVIDTQCRPIPTPTTAAPLALAGFLALRRRR